MPTRRVLVVDDGHGSDIATSLDGEFDVAVVDSAGIGDALSSDVDCLVVPAAERATDGPETTGHESNDHGTTVPVVVAESDEAGLVDDVRAAVDGKGDAGVHFAGFRTLQRATRELMRATDAESVADVAVRTASDVFNMGMTGVHFECDGRLEPAVVTDEVRENFDDPPAYGPDDADIWNVYETGDLWFVQDTASIDRDTPVGSGICAPLGDHGVLLTTSTEPFAFDSADRELVRLLAANVEAALDRLEHQSRLERLHETTRELSNVETRKGIAELATEAGRDIVGLTRNGVFFYDDERNALVAASVTAESREFAEPLPVFEPGKASPGRCSSRALPACSTTSARPRRCTTPRRTRGAR